MSEPRIISRKYQARRFNAYASDEPINPERDTLEEVML